MKRKESLDLKSRGNQLASKIEQEEKKTKKVVVTFFGKGWIIVLEMDKF